MAQFNHISPGDFVGLRPDSEFHNATVDTINAVEGLLKNKAPGSKGYVDPTVVIIKNNTGEDLGPYAPVKLNTPIYSRDSSDFYRKGLTFGPEINAVKPTGSTTEIIGITRGAIPAGGIGTATVAGATLMKYTGSSGDYLKTAANNITTMTRADQGQARIISTSNENSSGGDAYILLNQTLNNGGGGPCQCDEPVFACLEGDLYADDVMTAKVWPDFEDEIEVYSSPLMCDEDVIEECTMVLCHKIGDDWYAILEGGKCNCNCTPYDPGYTVYAYLLADSGSGGSMYWLQCDLPTDLYWQFPARLYIYAYSNNNLPADPNVHNNRTDIWQNLGVIRTFNDQASCFAWLDALTINSNEIQQLIPANNLTWATSFINDGFKDYHLDPNTPMATLAQMYSCWHWIAEYCTVYNCAICGQQTTQGVHHFHVTVDTQTYNEGHNRTLGTLAYDMPAPVNP